jgi:solute carrier family 45, member 1/2/4
MLSYAKSMTYNPFSTVWVGEVMAHEIDAEPTVAEATRAGELALLLSSIGK